MRDRDPIELAGECLALPRPWLVGVDVDGTLAPIVARPETSRLAPGALDALEHLAATIGVMVAVVSGRPLTDLRHRFEIPGSVMLLGSHGAEVGSEVDQRTEAEEAVVASTVAILESTAAAVPGAWVEHKPLAVALHVRQADDLAGEAALDDLATRFAGTPNVTLHRGHKVLEVAIRPVSKSTAFEQLRGRLEPATTFFIGDDQSDEHVFGTLLPTDVAVKVGPGLTSAPHRLASPTEVVAFLAALAHGSTPEPSRPEAAPGDGVRTAER